MTVTAERPRAHVLADLAEFNHDAKTLSRRGYCGTATRTPASTTCSMRWGSDVGGRRMDLRLLRARVRRAVFGAGL